MARFLALQDEDVPESADVVIVGGGVIGCATAFYATEAGLDSVVVERREALGALTTAASEECFRAQFDDRDNILMMMESIDVFEHFADVIRIPGYDIDIHQNGYLFLTSEEEGANVLRKRVELQHAVGLRDVELLGSDEIRRRYPFAASNVLAATYRARDGWLSTHELTYGFAKGSGALFALRTDARSIRLDAHGVAGLTTNRGEIATRCVVVAAGPFSGVVASFAGVQLPLSLIRRQKVILSEVPMVPQNAPMTIDSDTGAFWRPEVGGAALGWALPEEPGEPLEKVPTDWTFPAVVLEGVARLVPFWSQVEKTLTRDHVFLSAGQYTCTPDHKPIIGPCSTVPGLFFNLGYSGHGIMASPAGARRLVDLMLDPSANETNPFRADRFAEEGTGLCAESMVI